jgi:hypothetical protein
MRKNNKELPAWWNWIYTGDLKSPAERIMGSSPIVGTILKIVFGNFLNVWYHIFMKINYSTVEWQEKITKAVTEEKSMAEAARVLGMNYKTLRKYTHLYNIYKPNQAGVGISKTRPSIELEEILKGKHPQYQSDKLRKRLLEEKVFTHQCHNCLLSEWLEKTIPLELHHINGVHNDHLLTNLQLLCPNCHALTDNYRGKNTRINTLTRVA